MDNTRTVKIVPLAAAMKVCNVSMNNCVKVNRYVCKTSKNYETRSKEMAAVHHSTSYYVMIDHLNSAVVQRHLYRMITT